MTITTPRPKLLKYWSWSCGLSLGFDLAKFLLFSQNIKKKITKYLSVIVV
jgi:hypothetical protein